MIISKLEYFQFPTVGAFNYKNILFEISKHFLEYAAF
jgi:hypothetical protein